MFNKKIIASALILSLAFSLFPTNIFANDSLTEAEKKICENKDDLLFFDVNGNDLFALFNDKNAKNLDFEELKKLKPSYMTKNGEKIGENYLSDLVTLGAEAWFPTVKVLNGDFYDTGAENYIKNGKKLDFNFNLDGKIMINEKGDFIYQGSDFKFYKNGVKIDFPEDINIYTNKFGNLIYELNSKIYSNNIELNIPENAEIINETIQDGNFIYKLNEKYYNKNNAELKVGNEINNLKEELKSHDTLKQNYILNGNNLYIQTINENNNGFKIYKNGALIAENNNIENISNFANIIKINNSGKIYSFFETEERKGLVFKDGKPLCENLEKEKEKEKENNNNPNNQNNGISETKGSAPNKKDTTINNDDRVTTQNETKESKKSENNSLTENEKNDIKTLVAKIIKKYSYNKNILENLYKALNTREDIKKRAENNPRIKFVIEEYSRQYVNLK